MVAGLAAIGAIGVAKVHAAEPAALPPASPPDATQVSDERLVTRWAYPQRRAVVYSRPSGRARHVFRLHLLTEDQFPELYIALSRWTDPQGNEWLKIRLPQRPNGRTGWVRADALGTAAYAPTLSDWPNGGVVGLHGTNQPGLIPGRPSHGCIRVKNPDIARLWRLTPVGTPLLIK